MKSRAQVVYAVAFVIFSTTGSLSAEVVRTVEGNVEGTVLTSRLGRTFHAFLRIPFAKPPTGELRFLPPQPMESWTGTLNGTAYGPMCYQADARTDFEMSEDCLQLNVFTTNLTRASPVIFYIHGGSFEVGSGVVQGNPYNIMDREVVLVAINYRLGALGFLATGTSESPGNVGLKDQVMALKWVQRNIRSFGGDPNKITIAGLSAGALSVTAHMVSPMAKGLFHRVIAVSGAITGSMALKNDYLPLAKKLGTRLNCTTDNIPDMIACLRTKQPLDIVNQDLRDHPECEIVIWVPVVEPDFGQERFLPDDPVKIIEANNHSQVPIIIGRTTDEMAYLVPGMLQAQNAKTLNERFNEIAPFCFIYERDTKKSTEISETLRSTYFPFDKIDNRSFNGLSDLFSDSIIGYGVHRFVNLISNVTDVFYYKFSFIGRYSVFNYPHDSKPFGMHHADDIQYPFFVDYVGSKIMPTDPENFMVERMTRIYEHFAMTGNPNYDPAELNWPKHDAINEYYMDIGRHMIEKHGMYLERYAVWDELIVSTGSSSNLRFLKSLMSLTLILLRYLK